jgi:predicted GTPase
MTEVTSVVIVGAAGRDFHDFNVVSRDDFDRFVARTRRSG